MVDRLEPPPRMSGDANADVQVLRDYIWDLYKNLILEGGVPQTVDQPDEAVDPETGILTAIPIGAILTTRRSEDPATYLGYGVWVRIGQGQTIVGVDETDTDFDEAGKEAGSKVVTPAGTNSVPLFTGAALATHTHGVGSLQADAHNPSVLGVTAGADFDAVTAIPDHTLSGTTAATSGGTPAGTVSAPAFTGAEHSIVQPSICFYLWERTA